MAATFGVAEADKVNAVLRQKLPYYQSLIKRLELSHRSNLKPKSIVRLLGAAMLVIGMEQEKLVKDSAMINAGNRLVNYCVLRAGEYI